MNERIRQIREYYKLTRAAFGERIGVSGDVINNLERGRVDVKEHIIKLITREYSVSEKWLLSGDGEMIITPDTFSIDKYMNDRGATALEISIVKAYFDLDRETRDNLIEHFREFVLNDIASPAQDAATSSDTVDDAEAAYIKSRSGNVPNTGLSALNTTAGTDTHGENAVNE